MRLWIYMISYLNYVTHIIGPYQIDVITDPIFYITLKWLSIQETDKYRTKTKVNASDVNYNYTCKLNSLLDMCATCQVVELEKLIQYIIFI